MLTKEGTVTIVIVQYAFHSFHLDHFLAQTLSKHTSVGNQTHMILLSSNFLSLCVCPVLEQLLEQLQRFLKILDGEKLSGNAAVQKGLLTELLQSYKSTTGL